MTPCILGTLIWPLWLLWGFDQTVPLLLTLGLFYCCAKLIASLPAQEQASMIPAACILLTTAYVSFYNSGHRMTFNAIAVSAGFIGLPGFCIVRSIILIFCHTYAPFMVSHLLGSWIALTRNNGPAALRTLLNYFNLALTVRIVASQVGLIMLRRHLMIWNVFAPKFIYDAMILFLIHVLSFVLYGACACWLTPVTPNAMKPQ